MLNERDDGGGAAAEVKRWSSGRMKQVVLRLLRGESVDALSRELAEMWGTDGLLARLTPRELAGVLAHEVAHIASGDLKVMNLADYVSRLTGLFALVETEERIRRLLALGLPAPPDSWPAVAFTPGLAHARGAPRWYPGGIWR